METALSVGRKQENYLLIVTLLLTYSRLPRINASCSEDQLSSCRTSVINGDVLSTPGGGRCQETVNHYQFSHVCIVNNYLPNVAHCCCQLDAAANDRISSPTPTAAALCCRYHQANAVFRCLAPNDSVQIASHQNGAIGTLLVILLPTILIALLVSVSVAVVCCRRHNANVALQDDDTSRRASCCQHPTNTGCCCCCRTKNSPPDGSNATCLSLCMTSLKRHNVIADRQQSVKTTVERLRPPLTLMSQIKVGSNNGFSPKRSKTTKCYLEPSAPQLITVCTSPAVIVHDPALSGTRCRGDETADSSSEVHPIESTGWCQCGRQCDLPPPSYDEVQGQEAEIEPADPSVNESD